MVITTFNSWPLFDCGTKSTLGGSGFGLVGAVIRSHPVKAVDIVCTDGSKSTSVNSHPTSRTVPVYELRAVSLSSALIETVVNSKLDEVYFIINAR